MIPRVIHQIWIGPAMPDWIARCIDSWRRLNPDWEHRVWGERDLLDLGLVNRHLWDDAARLAPTRAHVFRADVARYEILRRSGGLYADADLELKAPIAQWLDDDVEAVALEAPQESLVANGLMGATPGHDWLDHAVRDLPAHVALNAGKSPWQSSGPVFLTSITEGRDDVAMLPRARFLPFTMDELHRRGEEFPDAWAVHHWLDETKDRGRAWRFRAHAARERARRAGRTLRRIAARGTERVSAHGRTFELPRAGRPRDGRFLDEHVLEDIWAWTHDRPGTCVDLGAGGDDLAVHASQISGHRVVGPTGLGDAQDVVAVRLELGSGDGGLDAARAIIERDRPLVWVTGTDQARAAAALAELNYSAARALDAATVRYAPT